MAKKGHCIWKLPSNLLSWLIFFIVHLTLRVALAKATPDHGIHKMKPNNDFHCLSHLSDSDRNQTSSSQLKGLDESHRQVCPYCVNSENSGSSANSSPSISPLEAVTVNRGSHISHFDFEPSAQPKDTSRSGYPTDAASHAPSSLKPTSGGRTTQMPAKVSTVPKMPFCPTNNKVTGGGRLKNSSHSAAPKSTTSLRNESDKSSYATSLSRTMAPADSKLSTKNSTRSSGTKASSVTQFSESGRTANSMTNHQSIPPAPGKIYATRRPPNFHVQQTSSSRQHTTSKRPEGLQSLMNDPVSIRQQTTSDYPNVHSSSTSHEPSTSGRLGTQPDTTSNRFDTPSSNSDHFGASNLPSIQPKTTGFSLTNQPRSEQNYRAVEIQRLINKSAPLPSQSNSAFNNSTPQESAAKPTSQQLETQKPTRENVEKSKPINTEGITAPLMSEIETMTAAKGRASPTKVEFSKLRTGSPEMTSSSGLHSNDKETKEIPVLTSNNDGVPYQTTTRRPMLRCTNSTKSKSTCMPDAELPSSIKQTANQSLAKHMQKSTVPYVSPPVQLSPRRVKPTSGQPEPASYSAMVSTTQAVQPATRPVWNRNTTSSLSIEDVGADGNRAYIIRKERREKMDWRRKPRYKVKQTATSRLRYGYWFADCGRHRVKAYRGDWSQIPQELLRDWEVYQNYFRYRVKGQRKRTSSLVRKLIAGKYHQKRMSLPQKRPIRKMSPLLLSKPSPPLQEITNSRREGSEKYLAADAGSAAVEDDSNGPPPIRGSNVRNLLMRRARAQLRQQQSVRQRVAYPARPVDVYRKPQIQVRSTVTSRLRKSSMLPPCGKPVTPTLWHGSTDEMEGLKRKIENRRQRLKDNWLKQTSALMSLASRDSVQAQEQANKRVSGVMAQLMVVGAPLTRQLGAVSSQCTNVASKSTRVRTGAAKMPAHKGAKRRNCSTASSRVAQHFIRQQLPAIPETDWSISSSQSDASAGTVAPVTNFCEPSSMVHESAVPVSSEPPLSHQNCTVKKKKFMAVRKVLSIARWLIAPAIPIKQNSTSAKRREISEKS